MTHPRFLASPTMSIILCRYVRWQDRTHMTSTPNGHSASQSLHVKPTQLQIDRMYPWLLVSQTFSNLPKP